MTEIQRRYESLPLGEIQDVTASHFLHETQKGVASHG